MIDFGEFGTFTFVVVEKEGAMQFMRKAPVKLDESGMTLVRAGRPAANQRAHGRLVREESGHVDLRDA